MPSTTSLPTTSLSAIYAAAVEATEAAEAERVEARRQITLHGANHGRVARLMRADAALEAAKDAEFLAGEELW